MSDHSLLAPRYGLELADEAYDFLRSRARQLLGLTALVVVPLEFLLVYIQRSTYAGNLSVHFSQLSSGGSGVYNRGVSVGSVYGALSLEAFLQVIGLALIAGPTARLVAAWKTGAAMTVKEALALPATTWLSLAAAAVLVHLAELIGVIGLGVGSLFAMLVFAIVSPVVALESAGPFRALRRSWVLTLRRFGPVLGVVAGMTAVTLAFFYAFGAVPTLLPEFVGITGGWFLAGVGRVLASLVTFSVTSVFVALLYIDLRVHTEAMDITVALGRW